MLMGRRLSGMIYAGSIKGRWRLYSWQALAVVFGLLYPASHWGGLWGFPVDLQSASLNDHAHGRLSGWIYAGSIKGRWRLYSWQG